ncbi:MAG: alpha/beta hydrolase [Pedobacter sp.]|nr:MAG: alpha/beta hydrolase [Pedobacter sp.]
MTIYLKFSNVSIEGNPDAAQTIVFAHGFGSDQTAWKTVKEAFAKDYRLVLYDNVGAGNANPDAYSSIKYNLLSTYADDMLAIFDDLQLKNAIVVAHSVSSMISLIAFSRKPEYLAKAVFIGASPRYLNDQNYTGGFTQPALEGMYQAMTNNYYAWASGFSGMAMGNPDSPELGKEFARTLCAIRPDIALSVAKVIFESDVRSELGGFDKEVLLVQAHEDIAVPEVVAEYLHANIKKSELKYVNATGHFPHISAPQEVIAAIKSFI